jgi:hypothetical protein
MLLPQKGEVTTAPSNLSRDRRYEPLKNTHSLHSVEGGDRYLEPLNMGGDPGSTAKQPQTKSGTVTSADGRVSKFKIVSDAAE